MRGRVVFRATRNGHQREKYCQREARESDSLAA